jgi:hypothetical protein
MVINKIIGKFGGWLMVLSGMVVIFGIINPAAPSNSNRFLIHVAVGPTLIYLGLKLLNMDW